MTITDRNIVTIPKVAPVKKVDDDNVVDADLTEIETKTSLSLG